MVVTGGGTAGHVIPLLAVASEYKQKHPSATIRYIGNYGDTFAYLADDSQVIDGSWRIFAGKFRRFHGIGKLFYVKNPSITLRNIRDLFLFLIGLFQSIWLLIWWRPNVVFVKGGFVGLPVGLAAALLRIPIVTHDSDTVPGLTNRILARYARFMAVAMPPEYYHYPKSRIRYTGLPIRDEFHAVSPEERRLAREQLGVPNDSFVVAVFGGSQGAVRLNEAVQSIAAEFMAADPKRWLLHQTGAYHFDEINTAYKTLSTDVVQRVRLWPFLKDIHLVSAAADIVVSRAGSSIHELSAQQRAVVLVPNPMLTGAHQIINARVLMERGAALVVTEDDLAKTNNKALAEALSYLAERPEQRKQLADALGTLAVPNAAAHIVTVLEEAAS